MHCVELGQRGHLLVLTKNDINKAELVVANVYAPNGFDAEKRRFLEELIDTIEDVASNYNCNRVIIAGDLNLVLAQVEVNNRIYGAQEQRLASDFKTMYQRLGMVDCWERASKRSFTWSSCRTGQQ